jgi:hypothetical protein
MERREVVTSPTIPLQKNASAVRCGCTTGHRSLRHHLRCVPCFTSSLSTLVHAGAFPLGMAACNGSWIRSSRCEKGWRLWVGNSCSTGLQLQCSLARQRAIIITRNQGAALPRLPWAYHSTVLSIIYYSKIDKVQLMLCKYLCGWIVKSF